jgi:hypothetical protein
MWFDPGLARLYITPTLLHLGEDINLLVVSAIVRYYMKNESLRKDIIISDSISNVHVSKVDVFFSCELSSDGNIADIEIIRSVIGIVYVTIPGKGITMH